MSDGNKELFKKLDQIIFDEKGRLNSADFFRLLSEYQLTRINDIENSRNEQQRIALCRTAMYDTDTLSAFKKTTSAKKKQGMVFKLVNLLCIYNDNLSAVHASSDHDKELFSIAVDYHEKILQSREWYLRTIPESKWLIEHLEGIPKYARAIRKNPELLEEPSDG